MRHVTVRRMAVLLTAIFVAGAGAFAWLAGRDASPSLPSEAPAALTGEALFARHCASCHRADDLRPSLEGRDSAARQALQSFLDGHGDAGPDDDRLIVDYLFGDNAFQNGPPSR